jgi:SPX domain protein involved in polyphosphate accumulation
MKFGKKIVRAQALSSAQWQQEWLNYKQLKQLIKGIEDEQRAEQEKAPDQRSNRNTNAVEMGKPLYSEYSQNMPNLTTAHSQPPIHREV